MEKKVDVLTRTSNDKMITLKIAKFCKERSTYSTQHRIHTRNAV